MDLRSWHLDNLTVHVWVCTSSLPYFVLIHFIFWIFNFQERNWAFSTPSEAWLLCEAGHEGHPHRPAHDLHPPPHVHRDFHEEVTVGPPLGRVSCAHPGTCREPARTCWQTPFFRSILPFEAVVCMYRFLGADKCMYPFIAQRKQATNNNEAKNGI